MRLSAWQYIFSLTLVFACGYANAGSIAKRDADDNAFSKTYDWTIGMSMRIPVVGTSMAGGLLWGRQVFNVLELLTNDGVSRFIGGALPCTIALDGTTCTGLTNNGGAVALFISVIDGISPYILPEVFKRGIERIIYMIIVPILDVMLGGISIGPNVSDS